MTFFQPEVIKALSFFLGTFLQSRDCAALLIPCGFLTDFLSHRCPERRPRRLVGSNSAGFAPIALLSSHWLCHSSCTQSIIHVHTGGGRGFSGGNPNWDSSLSHWNEVGLTTPTVFCYPHPLKDPSGGKRKKRFNKMRFNKKAKDLCWRMTLWKCWCFRSLMQTCPLCCSSWRAGLSGAARC